jgi:hypothetical protein
MTLPERSQIRSNLYLVKYSLRTSPGQCRTGPRESWTGRIHSPKKSLNQIGLETDVLVWAGPCPDRWDQWVWNHMPSIACILKPSASTSVRLKLANTVQAAIVWTLAGSMGCPSGRFFASVSARLGCPKIKKLSAPMIVHTKTTGTRIIAGPEASEPF